MRSAENYDTGMAALEAATGGTLSLRCLRPPRDLGALLASLRSASVMLVVCAARDYDPLGVTSVVVPELADRAAELDDVISQYEADAVEEIVTFPNFAGLSPADRKVVREMAASSLHEIEKATRRLVALRTSSGVSTAAARLGMAPVSLSRWLTRHGIRNYRDA